MHLVMFWVKIQLWLHPHIMMMQVILKVELLELNSYLEMNLGHNMNLIKSICYGGGRHIESGWRDRFPKMYTN